LKIEYMDVYSVCHAKLSLPRLVGVRFRQDESLQVK
jgi:hypothetical protein